MTKSQYEGGYYLSNTNTLIRTGHNDHTTSLDYPISDETLDALNTIQRTPWRINRYVRDIMVSAYESGSRVGNLPLAEPLELPRKTDEEWEAMSEAERADWKTELSYIHSTNAKMEGHRYSFLHKVDVAGQMRDFEAVWFPYFLDFRGRFYPMSQDLHPQGDDIAKALLEFADGKPLGERGLFWLGVRLANTYGEDKMSLEDRYLWALKHVDEILDSARDPLDGQRFWDDADEPWNFLATCKEFREAMALDDPSQYVSHLPVQQDGSCNGLQHLSALGRDPVGARATNVADNSERQDIYTEVAEKVAALVSQDAVDGNEQAHKWVGRVDRKVVKRAVMTTPYGVTSRGIADQLIQDGWTNNMDGRGLAAGYLRDKIVEAVDSTITAGKCIMSWLQDVAHELAKNGHPLTFTTPVGNVVQQAYYRAQQQRVNTLMGKLVLMEEDVSLGLDQRKQTLAAAPNVIHAFDAAHMTKTINRMAKGYSEIPTPISFSMIHDSFGTHACDVDFMSQCLREEFAKIYDTNWLQKLEDEWKERYPTVEIPSYTDYLTLGDFDVREVLRSEFFFA